MLEAKDSRLVYHILHPLLVQWEAVLTGLHDAGVEFETVGAEEWLDRVDASIEADENDPSTGMISMWRAAVSD